MKSEDDEPGELDCYTAKEFRSMLESAGSDLLPVLALAGLAGLRFTEILRMTWEEVLNKSGHIEMKATKSKTRSRRLITRVSALSAWLQSYRQHSGAVWPEAYRTLREDFAALRKRLEIPNRRNGLRHAFVSAHFALHSDDCVSASASPARASIPATLSGDSRLCKDGQGETGQGIGRISEPGSNRRVARTLEQADYERIFALISACRLIAAESGREYSDL
jgi:hypothetical protein